MCVYVHVHGHTCSAMCVDISGQLAGVSLYHVGPGDQTWMVRLGGLCLYLLGPLPSP